MGSHPRSPTVVSATCRYARAEPTSRSAYSAKRAGTALAAGGKISPTSDAARTPSLASTSVTRQRKGLFDQGDSIRNALQGGGGGRSETTATAWRNRLAAVQARRVMLEESMRAKAHRLVEARAEKEVRLGSAAKRCWKHPSVRAIRHSKALAL